MNEDGKDGKKEKGTNPFRGKTRFQALAEKSVSIPEPSRKGLAMDDNELGKQLIAAAERMDTKHVKELVKQGAPVDYVETDTGLTAVHYAAGHGNWEMLDVLLATGKCNLLIRDKRGRLPSRLAAEFRGNMEQYERLADLEKEQGRKIGINPTMAGNKPIPGYE